MRTEGSDDMTRRTIGGLALATAALMLSAPGTASACHGCGYGGFGGGFGFGGFGGFGGGFGGGFF